MENLAKKCLKDHRNPLTKFNLPAQKLFFAAQTKEEVSLIKEHQNQIKDALMHHRVERRSNRAQAIWLCDKKVAKVTKLVKNILRNFGYQNKEGIFLYPEEMLFLIETNRLEVRLNEECLTVEEAYRLVLEVPNLNLSKYRIYKKLVNFGYKLKRGECGEPSQNSNKLKRRPSVEDNTEPERKKIKSNNINTNESSEGKEEDYFTNVFNKLRKNMPQNDTPNILPINPDYYVSLPCNTVKTEPSFNLFICEYNLLERNEFSSERPCVFATCTDSVSFYKVENINLPFI